MRFGVARGGPLRRARVEVLQVVVVVVVELLHGVQRRLVDDAVYAPVRVGHLGHVHDPIVHLERMRRGSDGRVPRVVHQPPLLLLSHAQDGILAVVHSLDAAEASHGELLSQRARAASEDEHAVVPSGESLDDGLELVVTRVPLVVHLAPLRGGAHRAALLESLVPVRLTAVERGGVGQGFVVYRIAVEQSLLAFHRHSLFRKPQHECIEARHRAPARARGFPKMAPINSRHATHRFLEEPVA